MKKTNLFEKFNKVFYALLIMTAVSFTFTACDKGDDDPDTDPDPVAENTILEIVTASETHTQLEAFVTANTSLVSTLGGNGITLFAPNDAAFEKLRATLGVESLEQVNPDIIASVLAFHVHTAAAVARADMNSETSLSTVQGESITFNGEGNIATGGSDSDVLFIGDAIPATNGVVHVVETILVPPTIFATIGANLGKVSQTVLLGADFSTLASAIYKADTYAASTEGVTPLTEILAGADATLTVFAPVNAVFVAAGISLDNYTAEQWYGLISNHVVTSGIVLSSDLSVGQKFTSAAGGPITVLTLSAPTTETITTGVALDSDGIPTTAEGQVAVADIQSSNGVVHALAGVLAPPSLVMAAVNLNPDFTTLKAGIEKADAYATTEGMATLASVLSNPDATLTVFAPVNAVFAGAGITLASFTGAEWYGIIANHVVTSAAVAQADLSGVYTSAASSPLTILPSGGIDSDGEAGAEAQIVAGNAFVGANGIVHAINGILVLPPASTDPYEGTYSVAGTGVRGADNAATEWTSSVTFELSSGDVYNVSDITFGGYEAYYTDGAANPGELSINSSGAITISGVEDTVYGGDEFNGTGTVNTDGTISISVSNTFGDTFDVELTAAGSKVSFVKRTVKQMSKIARN